MRRLAATGLLIAAAPLLGGCATLGYYQQGISGQLELWRRSQSIDRLIADPATPEPLSRRLERVRALRMFASERLQLPDNGSYAQYVDLQRPFVVWNVFAAPAFSLEPLQHCFPLIGCLSYRGYFAEAAAQQAAVALADQGHDVYVGGVAAYSTLGWFADPVLSSMLRWDDTRLAQLIFHELAHQKVYVPDDSTFSEAFATAVAEIGVREWLHQRGQAASLAAWQQDRRRQQDFLQLVDATAVRLRRLYAIQADEQALRAAKAEVYQDMRRQYQHLRDGSWQGYDGYDEWFATVNNARMAAVATYHQQVPALLRLYEQSDDLPSFYAACAQAAQLSPQARKAWLQDLSRPQ